MLEKIIVKCMDCFNIKMEFPARSGIIVYECEQCFTLFIVETFYKNGILMLSIRREAQ